MSKERLDDIVDGLLNNRLELTSFVSESLEQAERVQELENEISQVKEAYKDREADIEWYQNMLGFEFEELAIELPIERIQGDKIKLMEQQNKHYREALKFYADSDNYKLEHFDPNLDDYMSTVDYDEGQKARQTIGSEKIND